MPRITTLASRWGFSAGAVLVFGGGLALYQMTSLVLGPAGSRQLHLSLAIPTVDTDELSVPGSSAVTHTLGTLAGLAPAPSSWVPPTPSQPASGESAAAGASPSVGVVQAPVVASPAAPPVASPSPATHAPGHRSPPKRDDDH